ncbi:MAG: hypothetical protein AB8C46_26180 [Burkholderiaceae bacterium]
MSFLNKLAPALVLLVAAPAGHTGITDLAKKTEPTKIETMARIPKDMSSENKFSCWQDGRLIFQAKGMKTTAIAEGDKPSLLMAGASKSIELMDFKNGLCIFERANRRSKK